MKKRMMKMAAMMMAMTMVMGSAMTVHASEDGCYHGDDGASYNGTHTLKLYSAGPYSRFKA